MSLRLITAPGVEPVSLAEAKAQLRVTASDEDALVSACITAARERCEHLLGRALIDQTWELTLDAFPQAIRLDNPPISSVTSLSYVDGSGNTVVWGAPNYYVDKSGEPGWIVPAYGGAWPADVRDQANAVIVRYVAGYGAAAAAVPLAIRQWILLATGTLFETREADDVKQKVQHLFVDGLLDRYRIWSV
ncbi:MAG TPA: phage head-tail connector protein [Burkholderiaceae bacterium]|nr:phage head-tail connector protein [Burkholderiaceae bacterium]